VADVSHTMNFSSSKRFNKYSGIVDTSINYEAVFLDPAVKAHLLSHLHMHEVSVKKKFKLTSTIEHEQNFMSLTTPLYLGEVLMGESGTSIDVTYDTGSDWLVVPDIACASCDGSTHDSSGATPTQSGVISERLYGSASLKGTEYRDKVCLSSDSNSCVDNFEYFSITE